MLLSEAKTQVRAYLDDVDADRYSDSVVEFALKGALRSLAVQYSQKGGTGLQQTVTVTTSSGAADLSSYAPIRIDSVARQSGSAFYPVPQVRNQDRFVDDTGTHTLRIQLQGAPTFPEGDGYSFDYGPGTSAFTSDAFDSLLILLAVKQLTSIDGERHLFPATMEQQYWDTALMDTNLEGAMEMVNQDVYPRTLQGQYVWSISGQTLQLSTL